MSETDVNTLSFEDALSELEQIVQQMETGQTSLDKSVKAYERGVALKNLCEKRLKDAQMKIEKLTLNSDGAAMATESFNPE